MKIQAISNFKYSLNNIKSTKEIQRLTQTMKADTVSFSSKYNGYTGWLEIPSCNKDSEGYCDNIDTLGKFKNESWDLGTDNATLLWNSDFHIYLDNGKPEIGIKYANEENKNKDVVKKIYTEQDLIPIRYLDIVRDHIKGHKIGKTAQSQLRQSFINQKSLENMFSDGIEKYTIEERLNAFGIETAINEDGKYILSEYRQPSKLVTFGDIGIDEDELLKNTVLIMGDADFSGSNATSLGSVEVIGGDVTMKNHKVKDLGKLAHVGGKRYCDNSDFHVAFELRYGVW